MYDKKTEANEFVGDTQEEATNQATRFYGVASEELQVAIPDEVSGASGREFQRSVDSVPTCK